MDLTSRLLAEYDQIVIYGAKGWIGRSAVSLLFANEPVLQQEQILFIGSKTELSCETGLPLNVYSAIEGAQRIRSRALFLNAAYLRREKLAGIEPEEYRRKNNEIISFGLELIKSGRIKTFINLSSGVANQGSVKNFELVTDPYARSKIIGEKLFAEACNSAPTHLLNCRIYNISGKYVNEFNNLALTNFIAQAKQNIQTISVKSPSTLRTYVDSVDLVLVLLELSLKQGSYQIDSGGDLISLGDLALVVSNISKVSKVEIPTSFEKSPDYFGNYLEFNELAKNLGIKLKNIHEQTMETMKAFL